MLKFGNVNYYLGWFLLGCSFFSLGVGVNFYLIRKIIFLEWGLVNILGVKVVILLLFD